MARLMLLICYVCVVIIMLVVTTWASLERNVLDNGELMADRWFVATLADAYLSFLTIYFWICYKEPGLARKVLWFFLVMLLGNLSIGAYFVWQLLRWNPAEGIAGLLLNRRDREKLGVGSATT